MKKLLSSLLTLTLVSTATPILVDASSTTTTASISFYDSKTTGKLTTSGQPVPAVERINYDQTTITHYKVNTWRDMPIINFFASHKKVNDFHSVTFKTINQKKHEVKLSKQQAKTYLNHPNKPVTLTWQNNTLLLNNQQTKSMPVFDK